MCCWIIRVAVKTVPYDLKAAKQTVSLTVNSDLYAKAKSFGINASQVAEEALQYELSARLGRERDGVRNPVARIILVPFCLNQEIRFSCR